MTRFLLLMILIFNLPIESYSCNIKKILTQNQLDSLSKGYEIFVFADNTPIMKNMTGTLRIKSHRNKLIYFLIGEWKEYFKETRNIKAYMVFDSLGCFQVYKEYSETGFNNYDCVYQKKQIRNETYLIETFKYFCDNGQLCETGQRYRKLDLKNGYISYLTHYKKSGVWIRYNYDGTLDYKKVHEEFEEE